MIFNIVKELKYCSGIYRIYCLANGKFDLGSTTNFYERFNLHKSQCVNGIHHSKHLQRAYDKYGSENFIFELVEVFPKVTCKEERNLLYDLEQAYLDKTQCWERSIGFNMTRYVKKAMFARHWSDEALIRRGSKRMLAYNSDGSFFKEFVSINKAKNELSPKAGFCICKGLKAKIIIRRGSGYFLIPHTDNYSQQITVPFNKNRNHITARDQKKYNKLHKKGQGKQSGKRREVIVYNWLGYPMIHFESLKQASTYLNITSSTLSEEYIHLQRPYKDLHFHYLSKQTQIPQI